MSKKKSNKKSNKSTKKTKNSAVGNLKNFYKENLKLLFIISLVLFVLGLGFVAFNYINTGEIVNRGIDLRGGTSISFESDSNIIDIENEFNELFDIENVFRELRGTDSMILEISTTDTDEIDSVLDFLDKYTISDEISMESTDPTLGEDFFAQISLALLFAFLFMSVVVIIYFREFIPSVAIVYSAFADIALTVAILNLIGVSMSSAGIAALLMLIGYSVDTDILLSTNVLKNESDDFFENVFSAMRTGFVMAFTTLVAVTVGYFVATSAVLEQIFLVLMIGLIIDMMNTWFVNTSFLRYYLLKKKKA